MTDRYARQISLPEIGIGGQEKLAAASVLCIGAGGLGCPALLYLAAAGIGRIGIVDFDHVDVSNLQRQVLFGTATVGQPKARAAKARLEALNPEINIVAYEAELDAQNALDLFAQYDLIIDGSDNFATKFLINDAAVKTGKPVVYGSISGFEGQVAVFNSQNGPCYRCLLPQAPKGHVPNCAEAGVIGAVAGLVGVTQAMEAIKIIVGHERFAPLQGKLWAIDMRSMETRILHLPRNPDCPVCTQARDAITLQYAPQICDFANEIALNQLGASAIILDVREQAEWDAGHIPAAHHLPLAQIIAGCPIDYPQDAEMVLYCQSGPRSVQARQMLSARGYTNLKVLRGGYAAWVAR